ncbi:MAG TPA: DUF222 domain-containing protein [Candidatus Dormibacteraeota bacterium]
MCSPEQSARDAALAELARLNPESLDTTGLMRQISDLSIFISQAQGQLARLAGALDASGASAESGHKSAASFLRTQCGSTAGHAGELVATARGLRRLPDTGAALDAGKISFDQAQVIVRATAGIDDEDKAVLAERVLLDNAPGIDVGQLRRLGEEIAYRAAPDKVEERERKRWDKRYLSFGLTIDDIGTISGSCGDTASFEIIRTAAEAFAPPGGQFDSRTAAQRRMDGLVTACKIALDTGATQERHGSAPHVSILVRDETLAQASGAAWAEAAPPARTGHGAMLTAHQVLAMCCGAQISAIRWQDGLPLDVGRAARTEPPGLRRALEARDLTCRWSGCDSPGMWCTGHHIKGWSRGARTSLDEVVLLCHVHHDYFIHQLGWTISGNPNGLLRFHHPAGVCTFESPLPGQRLAS